MTQVNEDKNKKESEKTEPETESKSEKSIGWTGVHVAFVQEEQREDMAKQLKRLILLDSDSNATIFCEEKYVNKIWDTKQSMGVGTNGNGHLISTQRCNVPLLGDHWFNKDSMTNIIALSDMTARFKVTMDSSKKKPFWCTFPTK